jgi:hexosaminidase
VVINFRNSAMAQKILLVFASVMVGLLSYARLNQMFNLMPVPAVVKANADRVGISGQFRVAVTGKPNVRMYAEASRFVRRLSNKTGIFLDMQGYVTSNDTDTASTLLINIQRPGLLKLGEDESYTLETHTGQIRITAVTDLGAIHGLETLLQLVSADAAGYYFPGVSIRDNPRFAWRGLLLDVALHFMPVDVVKRTLDGMCAVKMNVLHLHLCNDQGFRVESKLFPRLQQMASDGIFYTQEEIHTIVNYAAQRGIRVVPEFVVPAHTTAILTAYPEFASVKKTYQLQRYFGVFDPVMDPTNEKLYPFLEKLFTEMSSLFPDDYFHIGGDENTGKDWAAVPHIKAFMRVHGMKTTMDLQTYFNQRLLPIIKKTGKKMMGWDEVLQPGLPKEIIIQSWRGNEAFYSSVRKGYKAILSYGYYIDLIQPASYHYRNDPIPDSVKLTEIQKNFILGGEATMWSELVTPVTVDSRVWPRTAAIAERLWSPKTVNNVDDMYRRLDIVSLQLESLGLQHLSYKQALMRQLCNGYNTTPLEVLVSVLEPLKIYERNEGDTMYTVFSPFTKLADIASPDQEVPRIFNEQMEAFLINLSTVSEKEIRDKLILWQENNKAFKSLLLNSPALSEASLLSENLSALASAGLEALQYIHDKKTADTEWLKQKTAIASSAKQQGGRCEIQVVNTIQKLIERVTILPKL